MIELEEALARILPALPAAAVERVPLGAAHRRFLAETQRSSIDLPRFDNSAMDGYAVRSADLARASADSPVKLRLAGRAVAGSPFAGSVAPGHCVRLFTGSVLPAGADSVVMQEDTRVAPETPEEILVLEPTRPWEHVRLTGEDVKRGDLLIEQGHPLTAARAGLLAATGVAEVPVGKRPVVGLLSTGTELREAGETLGPGQIFESNRAALIPLIEQAGGLVQTHPLVMDSLAATRAAIEQALAHCDLLVTSGGVSVGETDFVRDAFVAAGGRLEFWKVAIKPGRPFVWGRRANQFLFGLPGNPVSAFVTFLMLVRPALLRWQGATETNLARYPGVLAEPLSNPGNRRHFLRVRVEPDGRVFSAGVQASHALSSLGSANGLLDLPPDATLAAGSPVKVSRWD
ncbi:MAG TPA: gephyrin-like molybdotransferase Glp [Methylomirabilota bacterium]|nr:gephyrin-like molybdotransferase Glp [Methylomirabilota bacterium]